ncbi:MAG: acyl-CoA reductase [Solirubrobacteraceae bacterium]
MATTATALTVPALIRGRLHEQDLIEFGARDGQASFRAPDPQRIGAALVLRDPRALSDLQALPFDAIVEFLAAVGERLRLDATDHLKTALAASEPFSDMTAPLVKASFEQIPTLFTPEAVREHAEQTIGIEYLEGWVPRVLKDGRQVTIKAFGARTVHVIAGNSPLIAAMSIIRNAICRSDAVIKLPSNDLLTALAIARTMAELDAEHPVTKHLSVAYWKGGDQVFEERLYQPSFVEKIIAWGGFASVTHVLRYVQPGLELIALDPKRSATIIGPEAFASEDALQQVARKAATDVGALNQLGCVNARVIFVAAEPEDAKRLGQAIYEQLGQLPEQVSTKAKRFDPELKAQLDGLRASPDFYRVIGGADGEGAVVVSQLDEPVEFHRRLSGRVANIVPVPDVREALQHVNAYTQTVGIYPESLKHELRDELALSGAQRLVSLGHAADASVVLPQDAIEPVRRMVKWIVDESWERVDDADR